jgi:hypothetical protein
LVRYRLYMWIYDLFGRRLSPWTFFYARARRGLIARLGKVKRTVLGFNASPS